MIQVVAPSRLHFGLLHVPMRSDGSSRAFGGLGLMIREPALRLQVRPAADWSAEGPGSERAPAFARKFQAALGLDRPCALRVLAAPPSHVGLGSGTQLALATARGIAEALSLPPMATVELARSVGRGLRSGIGIHGFDRGGVLVDGGKKNGDGPAPLVVRHPWPEEWRVAVFLPETRRGMHGPAERAAFGTLASLEGSDRHTDALCRLVLLDLLPALVERDLQNFGEALYEINRRVGEFFAPVQGGAYAGPETKELIEELRRRGLRGVGQSSWGPTVFAILPRDEADRLPAAVPGFRILMTTGSNTGARVLRSEDAEVEALSTDPVTPPWKTPRRP